jgi:hypothetical protein
MRELNSTQKETSRFLIRRFCERVEANRASIHYAQIRPMPFGRLQNFTTDCSGLVTCAYRWADIYSSFAVSDPNGLAYSGQGYTGTLLAHNKKHCVPLDRKFFVGDMGIYGTSLSNTTHVVICRKDGDVNTSIWTSHGSEDGPYPVRLHYRSDLLVVVRSGDLV